MTVGAVAVQNFDCKVRKQHMKLNMLSNYSHVEMSIKNHDEYKIQLVYLI